MAVLPILKYGDPLLRQKAEKVHKVSAKIQKLIDDMFDTMYANDGVGLAAPQVGQLKRLFVLDCGTDEKPMPKMVFINPYIVKRQGAIISKEGCLSFPEVFTTVKRYETVTLRFMDEKGRQRELVTSANSLLSRAIQHEMDHLNGVLFVDHVVDAEATDAMLAEKALPAIDPALKIDEPDLDAALATLPSAPPVQE
jgi:peptide deformylase